MAVTKVAYRFGMTSRGHPTLTTWDCVANEKNEEKAMNAAKAGAEAATGIPADAWSIDLMERLGVVV